jgi:pyruvate,water dikinase
MRSLDASDLNELTEVSRKINGLFMKGEIPEQLSDAILSRYHELRGPVAVRSSGVAEDQPGASFAGQHESFLNVDNDKSLLLAIKQCWASLFSSRALSYRAYLEKDEDNMEMAVLIQEMVDAEISGVMFTLNPIVSAPEILIEAFYGLGESVVSGRVTPERYSVDKLNGRIKTVKLTPNRRPSKTDATTGRLAANESARRNGQILSAEQVGELSRIGTKLENHFGCAQDIEWAIKAKEFYIIQSRPVLAFPDQERR